MRFEESKRLRERAHRLVPGGAHTYAKGDDQYPEEAPGFIARGSGSHVWDVDGNEFIEYGAGLRSVTLGHAFPEVVEAAARAMRGGSNFVRPARIELEMAERMLSIIPGAEMVKFAKNGSDVTTAAVKLARAFTGRDLVAVCAEHPFFSTDDWFIGITPMDAGIPKAISDLTVKFRYNDLDSLDQLFAANPGRIACIVMEAATAVEPAASTMPRSMSSAEATPSAYTNTASLIMGQRIRLTANPGASLISMGVLPNFSVSALVVAKVASLVTKPRMSSTSFITGTGLKKCMPTTFSGRLVTEAISVIERPEVFEARIVSLPQN